MNMVIWAVGTLNQLFIRGCYNQIEFSKKVSSAKTLFFVISPFADLNISSRHFHRQFTYAVFYFQNRKMCLSRKIFHQYFVDFLPCLGQLLLWKHFICHYIALKI